MPLYNPSTASAGSEIKPNRIINGNMIVDQRNGGAIATTVNGGYHIDRFKTIKSNAATTRVQQLTTTPPAGHGFYLAYTCTVADATVAAGDYEALVHIIEGLNVSDLDFGKATASQVTLSFWVKATKTGTSCVGFQNSAQNRTYIAEFTINTTNTWEQKTITIAGDTSGTWLTDTGKGIQIRFPLMCGTTYQTTAGAWAAGDYLASSNQVNHLDNTSNVFNITGVKLEAGTSFTGDYPEIYGDVLSQCLRYFNGRYQVCSGLASGTSNYAGTQMFPIPMRAAPTISNIQNVTIANGSTAHTQSSASISSVTSTVSATPNLGAFGGALTANTPYLWSNLAHVLYCDSEL